MQARAIIGGLLLAAGLLSAGCGGTGQEPEQDNGQIEQEVASCAAGYTAYSIWECEPVCGANYGNALHRYCTNGTDTYDAGIVRITCGACY
ncbi:hypothetical protein [Hyalangium sp.]|uniref:hypothetical protein n=1 Tax=Hyalangium sp. TaxID=2028555 RepID=UPI002D726BA0|nr:hypothetical protein [Hyalangium sp.]HYH94606.1 hypothetical protein [Hyalangium sp.]